MMRLLEEREESDERKVDHCLYLNSTYVPQIFFLRKVDWVSDMINFNIMATKEMKVAKEYGTT